MPTSSADEAGDRVKQLINEATTSHKPILITGNPHNAVLSEKDWSASQETLYLLALPGMRESIKKGLSTPVEECDEKLNG